MLAGKAKYDLASGLEFSPVIYYSGLSNSRMRKNSKFQGITKMAGKMGCRRNKFASSLRSTVSRRLSTILPRLSNYFTTLVLIGIEDITNKLGYNLIISQLLRQKVIEIRRINTNHDERVDGLVIFLADDPTTTNYWGYEVGK